MKQKITNQINKQKKTILLFYPNSEHVRAHLICPFVNNTKKVSLRNDGTGKVVPSVDVLFRFPLRPSFPRQAPTWPVPLEHFCSFGPASIEIWMPCSGHALRYLQHKRYNNAFRERKHHLVAGFQMQPRRIVEIFNVL